MAKAGYIAIDKRFVGRRPQTGVQATRSGLRAFASHVAHLRSILDGAES